MRGFSDFAWDFQGSSQGAAIRVRPLGLNVVPCMAIQSLPELQGGDTEATYPFRGVRELVAILTPPQ